MLYASKWRGLPTIINMVAILDETAGAIAKAAGKSAIQILARCAASHETNLVDLPAFAGLQVSLPLIALDIWKPCGYI